ncbi:hypothetical protein [Amycolatopsis taiwanensis]|uniref:hypothetical protein n=1 Tax=Amycolatopsis taiwanensis TaxID=342230 RepID=UPI0004817442|nr:hypothetical protein [Amycolatopsis taiwanensis]
MTADQTTRTCEACGRTYHDMEGMVGDRDYCHPDGMTGETCYARASRAGLTGRQDQTTTDTAHAHEHVVSMSSEHVPADTAALRVHIAEAFRKLDAERWGYDNGFVPYGGDEESDSFVDAAVAVIAPALADLSQKLAAAEASAGQWRNAAETMQRVLAALSGDCGHAEHVSTRQIRACLARPAGESGDNPGEAQPRITYPIHAAHIEPGSPYFDETMPPGWWVLGSHYPEEGADLEIQVAEAMDDNGADIRGWVAERIAAALSDITQPTPSEEPGETR